jgi:hypothetical protein
MDPPCKSNRKAFVSDPLSSRKAEWIRGNDQVFYLSHSDQIQELLIKEEALVSNKVDDLVHNT